LKHKTEYELCVVLVVLFGPELMQTIKVKASINRFHHVLWGGYSINEWVLALPSSSR